MRVRLVAAATAVGLFMSTGIAAAAVRPHVQWRLPAQATAGAPTAFTYTTTGVRAHDKIVVQRAEGTGQVWRTTATLHARQGSGTVPALGIGSYTPRIAVIRRVRRGKRQRAEVVAARKHPLAVFGTVPFSSLMVHVRGYTRSGVQTTATGTFLYTLSGYAFGTLFTVGVNNPCKQVTMQLFNLDAGTSDPGPVTATIVQQSADPVSGTAAFGSVGSVTADLIPGQSWGLNLSSDESAYWYMNGSAVCDSTTLLVR